MDPCVRGGVQTLQRDPGSTPVLGKPKVGEPLYLYLAKTEEALAAVLVREEGKAQQQIYFVSALQGAEPRYNKLEKLALALLTSSRILRQYFQGHQIVVKTDQRIHQGLKKRLGDKKGAWADELTSVLWSYRITEQSSTEETPFRLTYGVDAMIPVEIGEPSPRLLLKGVEKAMEKDLVDEAREMAHLTEVALKQRMTLRYNAKVLKREFGKNDLVLRHNDIGLPTQGEGKLATNWEGPYRVKEVLGKGAYKLEKLDGKEIPRT
ncbi:uncharacterized protein LOC110275733 [Arachis duranensis]|uniref:Uncharacterized protein LOC110275733 n=1 Tax=Arachis duranensis TaxID=130453 RepID=A0A6P5MQP8_ARADU|nr:uncharacterized protein LOC110275733 [Arachis duranensis]